VIRESLNSESVRERVVTSKAGENIVPVLVTSTEINEQALAAASASTTLRASMHRNRLMMSVD
jgi:hypothetical protein